ncbi:MAG: alpha/beta hydrolase [Deltaproteobacteria bacterium]|nr:alpha/beta hydrolase [Deltaproteobacteria bacterium]
MSVLGEGVTVEFVEAGGVRFEMHTAGDPSSRRLALCLHGFPEHAVSWRWQIPLLASLGFKVWAPNQRGYGASTLFPKAADYGIEHLTGDIGNLIDAADVDEVVLVGHDWGAIVAWTFAAQRVRPIDRLVIMNVPHPTCLREALQKSWRQKLRSWYALFFQIPWLPERLLTLGRARSMERMFRQPGIPADRFPDALIEVYRKNALRPGGMKAMIDWYRASGRSFGRDEPLAKIETPTLMLWGENDFALGKELTYGTDQHVSDLTLRYLPGVSHWVQQEAPETVNRMLEAWLQEREVPEAEASAA